MKIISTLLRISSLLVCVSSTVWADECFLSGDKAEGALCKERLPPCSSFKLPLAVMTIDAGILDEKTVLPWDKTPQQIKSWEQDADARTWLKESIVWFSQRLTVQLGLPKIEKYLAEFEYGNRDFSGGIEKSWLDSSLLISAEEQMRLLQHLGRLHPDAAKRAIALLPAEGEIRGKTGSCPDEKRRIGWYIGYQGERPFVYVFRQPRRKDDQPYSGLDAKKWVLARLR
jgi:beta-lactamase class D